MVKAAKRKRKKAEIHDSIKEALGYEPSDSDDAVYADWKDRTSRVCKPCWELKYCPYGPLVEQSPTIPPLRSGMVEHIDYFRRCLETNLVGNLTKLTDEDRKQYEEWASDHSILLKQAHSELGRRAELEEASKASTDDEKIDAWIGGPLPPIHIYRAPFDIDDKDIVDSDFPPEVWRALQKEAETIREKYLHALKSGEIDNRSPLEPARAAWFRRRVENFNPDEYPETVPDVFLGGDCNVFGHVCPVFFAAEASTESSTERRRGRYISFEVKMRVVRRDNYTCQHCGKHLKDDEVEFDHMIPVSKGGSSEEQNIRLTCFDCNREKSDEYMP